MYITGWTTLSLLSEFLPSTVPSSSTISDKIQGAGSDMVNIHALPCSNHPNWCRIACTYQRYVRSKKVWSLITSEQTCWRPSCFKTAASTVKAIIREEGNTCCLKHMHLTPSCWKCHVSPYLINWDQKMITKNSDIHTPENNQHVEPQKIEGLVTY